MRARTQSSIAVRGPRHDWLLINASPDLRQQILTAPTLAPREGLRDSPICAVVLTNADIDHVAGLLSLRERWPFCIFATKQTLAALDANPLFNALSPDLVARKPIALDQPFEPIAGVTIALFAVPGKVPLWDEGGNVETSVEDGRTVGVAIGRAAQTAAYYIPGCAALSPRLAERLRGAALLLFDGTLFEDDEMIRLGLGEKTGRRMGHMPVNGDGGSLSAFEKLGVARKIYIHVNNSNPILVDGCPERRIVEEKGWTVAEDGMEIALWRP